MIDSKESLRAGEVMARPALLERKDDAGQVFASIP
jgi:hypothetical protein